MPILLGRGNHTFVLLPAPDQFHYCRPLVKDDGTLGLSVVCPSNTQDRNGKQAGGRAALPPRHRLSISPQPAPGSPGFALKLRDQACSSSSTRSNPE